MSQSARVITGNLDLFSLSPSDVSTEKSYHVPVFPTVSLKEASAPLEFSVKGVKNIYLDLAESYLYLNVRVQNVDGSTLNEGEDVSCSNFLAGALFDLVEVYLEGKLVSSKQFYHYVAYMLAHLSNSKAVKEEVLYSGLYIADTNASTVSDVNTGYLTRKTFLAKSANIELVTKIYDDVFIQSRWILPEIDIRIKLRRAPVKFTLLAGADSKEYMISIDEAVFYCMNQVVSPKVIELHSRTLSSGKNALYPFVSSTIKCLSIGAKSLNYVAENFLSCASLPLRLVVGFVETEAVEGKYTKNPFCFSNFSLTKFTLSIDNVPLDYRALTLNFNKKYLLAWQMLRGGLNLGRRTVGIDRKNYLDGNNFFAFQLQSYESQMNFYPNSGNLKIELGFASELRSAVTAIILIQTQNILTIDKNKVVSIENQGILT